MKPTSLKQGVGNFNPLTEQDYRKHSQSIESWTEAVAQMLLSLGIPILASLLLVLAFGLDAAFWIISIANVVFLFILLGIRIYLKRTLPRKTQGTVAFFHPNANGGGGGERVLWCGIKAIQEAYPFIKIVIYCGDGLTAEELRSNAQRKFAIEIPNDFKVVPLTNAHLLDPEGYPRFTLVGQAIGSVRMAFSALLKLRPQVFVDTSGWAFMYPLVRLAGVKVACYTHYPTISTDMLLRVAQKKSMYNNKGTANTLLGSVAKLGYYYTFACFYGMAGGCANVVMVNSSWTKKHIRQLWWKLSDAKRVFPPCNTKTLQALPIERRLKRLYLVSVAQFRPEKDHALQLESLALARSNARRSGGRTAEVVGSARLVMIGSCRGAADQARIDALKAKVEDLGLQNIVEFEVNVSFDRLRKLLSESVGGLHTMLDEHFGISVVEYMAAGVVPVAHNSGGPRADIVDPPSSSREPNGFLCTTAGEFAEAITLLLCMEERRRTTFALAARRKAQGFTDELFEADFLQALQPLLSLLEAPS